MKAQKINFKIEVEVLDEASILGMVEDVMVQFLQEADSGVLEMADGDQVAWEIKRTPVEF